MWTISVGGHRSSFVAELSTDHSCMCVCPVVWTGYEEAPPVVNIHHHIAFSVTSGASQDHTVVNCPCTYRKKAHSYRQTNIRITCTWMNAVEVCDLRAHNLPLHCDKAVMNLYIQYHVNAYGMQGMHLASTVLTHLYMPTQILTRSISIAIYIHIHNMQHPA